MRLWIPLILASLLAPVARADDGVAFFESRVRPILVEQCYSCHSAQAKKLKAGLYVDSRAGLLKGGESGPSLVPGDPAKSRLIEAVAYENVDLQMPPKDKLSDSQIADLRAWVAMGAPWPGDAATATTAVAEFDLQKRKAEHWAWHPVKPPTPPAVGDAAWVADPIDRFVLAKLEEQGMRPAPDAARRTLLRRVTFDLTGLPPTPAEADAFEKDASPDALAKVVDRLLGSPRFGERWGRHWLDLVRYAETMGHEFDFAIPNAWRYRDYVIRALNADVPYDRFVTEQIAGDLIENPRRGPGGENESVVGTTFWFMGEDVQAPVDVRQHQADLFDNRIDVLGKSVQGMTIACARCHDHKFDAISAADYYALYGTLKGTRYTQAAVNQAAIDAAAARLRAARGTVRPTASSCTLRDGDAELLAGREETWRTEGAAFERAAAGFHSGLLSKRLEGTVRSPSFVLERPFLHVRAAGQGGRVNVVLENFVVIRAPIYGGLKREVKGEAPAWITIDVSMWKGRQAYVEVADTSVADPGGPGAAADGWVSVERVVASDHAKPPQVDGTAAPAEKVSPDAAYRELEAAIPAPVYAVAAADADAGDEKVFIRGNPKNLGPVVPRRFLEAVDRRPFERRGSGRLELARRIADLANPLTARVMVNRVWHHLFGRGIVASVDNFGQLGDAPTHPALLDHLADRFVKEGWSVKRLIRAVVLTRAYRMSSVAADAAFDAADPENVFLHRANVRRLQGEAIRDALLAVSGQLDLAMGGPGVPVHLTAFMEGRGRPGKSGPLDGGGRRSVYLEVRRNFLPPMLLAFDTPIPFSAMGRRSVSNVPAQALILMNDPFVLEQAKRWAARALAEEPASTEARVGRMYEAAFGRRGTAGEVAAVLAFAREQGERMGVAARECESDPRVWADVAHALANTKEFIFLK